MARVTIQDALDHCLVNPDGLSVEELLTKYPEYRAELQPLLALSANITTLEPPPVPVDRRAAMKQRLMEVASAGATTAAISPQKVAPASRPWWESLSSLIRRPALASALGTAAVIALLWWSAAGSLPDSPLYGLKLTSEDALRNFASGTSARIDSYLNSAGARLNDIKEMQRREKLAQAAPAIDSYRSSIANSATLWEQTGGEERTNLAKKLYVFSAQGFMGFGAIAPDLSTIVTSVRTNISETISVLESLRADTGGTLIASNIDVNALLLDADIEPSSVPTPLPKFALGTATVTVPVVAASTQTSIAATQATEAAQSSAAQLTAEAIIAASGGLSAGTPSARMLAAQTVVAGGAGPERASAQLTVLAPVVATETSPPTATQAKFTSPTATKGVPQTSIPTSTRVAPGATRTVQPPTARPATNTPRPPQATSTRRATTTPRILPQTTGIPIVPTLVPRTIVPTFTQVLSATVPVTTFTPVPSSTPFPVVTEVPPMPTVTAEPPLLPTFVPDTPTPAYTAEPPMPNTPLPLPSVTVVLPSPPLPTLTLLPIPYTPLPLPTEIFCALDIEEVDISCGPGNCLDASVLVHNESSSGVSAAWTAELRVRVGSGNYITLSTQTGSNEFAPGDTRIEPRLCPPLPIGTTLLQVRFSLVSAGCSDQRSSGGMQPCSLP